MSIDADVALEGLARIVRVVGREGRLRQRFCELARLSPTQRFNAIHIMAEQMAARRRDADLVAAFRLLGDARVFAAALTALRECGYLHE